VGARERHLHSIARPHPVRFPFRSDPKLSNSGYSLPQIDRIFHLFFVGAFFSGFWVGLSWVAMRIEEFQSKLGGGGGRIRWRGGAYCGQRGDAGCRRCHAHGGERRRVDVVLPDAGVQRREEPV
jgi:hypothetical protein